MVIAGPSESPIVKGLALDLERRGFVVYVIVGSAQEEQKVQENGRVDIRPLYMDITEVRQTTAGSADDCHKCFMVSGQFHIFNAEKM